MLFDKVVLSRLEVDNTYEDIDANFSLIWKKAQLAHIVTLSQYNALACSATSTNDVRSNITDLYAVPDYSFTLLQRVDKKFGRYAKEDLTQLVFIFESMACCIDFPLGVKTK